MRVIVIDTGRSTLETYRLLQRKYIDQDTIYSIGGLYSNLCSIAESNLDPVGSRNGIWINGVISTEILDASLKSIIDTVVNVTQYNKTIDLLDALNTPNGRLSDLFMYPSKYVYDLPNKLSIEDESAHEDMIYLASKMINSFVDTVMVKERNEFILKLIELLEYSSRYTSHYSNDTLYDISFYDRMYHPLLMFR